MKLINKFSIVLLCLILIVPIGVFGRENTDDDIPKLQNPMSVQYLKKYLLKSQPRLALNSKIEKNLKNKLKSDPVVKNIYEAIRLNASQIQKEPFLERIK